MSAYFLHMNLCQYGARSFRGSHLNAYSWNYICQWPLAFAIGRPAEHPMNKANKYYYFRFTMNGSVVFLLYKFGEGKINFSSILHRKPCEGWNVRVMIADRAGRTASIIQPNETKSKQSKGFKKKIPFNSLIPFLQFIAFQFNFVTIQK